MKLYPHNAPIILNDSVFTEFGGQTGSYSASQRNLAYRIAEQQATTFLNTLLLPTIVTGTFGYQSRIVTDYGYVNRVLAVNILSRDNWTNCTLQSDSGCVFVWEDTFGYLDVSCVANYCGCGGSPTPSQVQVVYEAGLPTGVASQPAVLLALTMAATISLNEMIFPSANESTGDIGVKEFTSMGYSGYSEKRVGMQQNAFGSSAKAVKIGQLLSSTIRRARPKLYLR
jgi:hypothetical protein